MTIADTSTFKLSQGFLLLTLPLNIDFGQSAVKVNEMADDSLDATAAAVVVRESKRVKFRRFETKLGCLRNHSAFIPEDRLSHWGFYRPRLVLILEVLNAVKFGGIETEHDCAALFEQCSLRAVHFEMRGHPFVQRLPL